MRCGDVMSTNIECCFANETLQQAAARMRFRNVGFLPVLSFEGQLVGTITDRDIAVRAVADGLSPTRAVVGQVMSTGVVYVHPDEPLSRAEDRMMRFHKSRVVVVDRRGRPLGVISLSDVAEEEWSWRAGTVLKSVSDREAGLH